MLIVMLGVLGVGLCGVVVYAIAIYNGLVRVKHKVSEAWANIDVLLTQRHDEIPKLVEVCKGYMKHEQQTLEKVVQARNLAAQAAPSLADKAKAETGLVQALAGLFAVVENYPELKANQSFLNLQRRITAVEEQIADRRELYNSQVNRYNVRIEQFPDVLVARALDYSPRELWEAEPERRQDPVVSFA